VLLTQKGMLDRRNGRLNVRLFFFFFLLDSTVQSSGRVSYSGRWPARHRGQCEVKRGELEGSGFVGLHCSLVVGV
jgi:hypothetical protein